MVQVVCDKCNRSLDKRGYNRHKLTCTGKEYIPKFKTKPRKKKIKNDKTNPLESIPSTSTPGIIPPESGLELQSKKLININLKGEYDKMTTVLNPKKEKDTGKEKKYQCSECGATFDNLKDGTDCPDCGVRLK